MSVAQAFLSRDYKNENEITGKVSHLYHASERFSAGVIQATDGPIIERDCRFSVPAMLRIDETVTLSGAWIKDNKYGMQFKATSVNYPMPDATVDGLANYLADNPAFHGIGPTKARLIADAFGDGFDNIIRTDPETVARLGKLTQPQVEALQHEWTSRADVNAISSWLAGFGLTHSQIKKIAERYGNQAKPILEANPYILCDEVAGFGFGRTDEIALKMNVPKDHPGRIRACLQYLVQNEADEGGHTWMLRKDLVREATAKLAFDTLDAERLIRKQLAELCEGGESTLVSVEDDKTGIVRIALRALYHLEMAIGQWLREAASLSTPFWLFADDVLADMIAQAASSTGATPSGSQRAAVEMVLRNRISVISGGAGTGKSYTIALIYRLYSDAEWQVGLCAPTGKAARRMSQLAAGATASTIHRLLGYNPAENNWKYNDTKKLPYDLVIVDEASMCDVALLWRLMSAIDFTRTQLLFVGDHNQLPPVGVGNVLRDVLAHRLAPQALLTQCFRNAGMLKQNCNLLLEGKLAKTTPVLPAGGREWFLIDSLEDADALIAQLRNLVAVHLPRWGYHPLQDCIILTPYNKGKLGVNRLNRELQRLWQRQTYNVDLPTVTEGDWDKKPRMLVGDKIMQVKNDYKLGAEGGVMNGTMGVVTSITTTTRESAKRSYVIQFEDQAAPVEIEMGSERENNVALAYAVTTHKSQGSEWPCAIAIVHRAHTYMLDRCLVYTAATRARRTTILLGDKLGFRRAVRTVRSMERRTWLSLTGKPEAAE